MKSTMLHAFDRFDRVLTLTLEWICITLFAAITVILTLNIFIRFVPLMSMHWFDEILELLYGALIFYGAAAVWVTHSHFSVGDWISKYLKTVRARFVYRLVVELFSLVFAAVFFKYALDITLHTDEQTTAFAMSKKWLYVCIWTVRSFLLVFRLPLAAHPRVDHGGDICR